MGSNIPKIGTSDIVGCYVGSNEVEKIYLGNDIIYEKSVTPTEKTYTWNYQLVGTSKYQVHVEDQVISNLTSKSYIILPSTRGKVYNPQSLDMKFVFNTGNLSTWGTYDFTLYLFANSTGSSSSCINISKTNMGLFSRLEGSNNDTITSSSIIADNTNYSVNLLYDGVEEKISLYNLDINSEVFASTLNKSNVSIVASNYIIVGYANNSPAVNGMSIDLNKSYIKVNGALIQDITENT